MGLLIKETLQFKQSFDKLNKLRGDEDFCDVTLDASGGVNVRAHKLILAAASPYFESMFRPAFLESDKNKIKLTDINGGSLRVLIDYIYTGKIIISDDNVEDILSAGNFLQIQSV